jgi:hypothetical protein
LGTTVFSVCATLALTGGRLLFARAFVVGAGLLFLTCLPPDFPAEVFLTTTNVGLLMDLTAPARLTITGAGSDFNGGGDARPYRAKP